MNTKGQVAEILAGEEILEPTMENLHKVAKNYYCFKFKLLDGEVVEIRDGNAWDRSTSYDRVIEVAIGHGHRFLRSDISGKLHMYEN